MLLRWQEDPVDAHEEARKETIFTRFQHNRNPFVDRPEWVPGDLAGDQIRAKWK